MIFALFDSMNIDISLLFRASEHLLLILKSFIFLVYPVKNFMNTVIFKVYIFFQKLYLGPTLILAYSKEEPLSIFGGFAAASWDCSSHSIPDAFNKKS